MCVMWDCCFFFINYISHIFSITDIFFCVCGYSLLYTESQIDTYAKGQHVYKDIWTPEIGESLNAQIEPNNPVDK